MKIKAVLFDLGDTLVYQRPEETFQKILKAHGIDISIDVIKQALLQGNREFDIEKHLGLPAHEFYTSWNLVELKHLGIIDQVKAKKLAEDLESQWFKFAEIYVYPDVKETLRRLESMGLRLGIITGGYEEDLEQILPKTGLEAFFDVCVGVNTIGKRKPHPDVFKYALKQLGIKPQEAAFVGDDVAADYLGAQNAGLTPILIRREGVATSDVRSISRLDEIFDILEKINP